MNTILKRLEKRRLRATAVIFVIMSFIAIVFARTLYNFNTVLTYRKILSVLLIFTAVVVFPLLSYFILPINGFINKSLDIVFEVFSNATKNLKRTIINVLLYIIPTALEIIIYNNNLVRNKQVSTLIWFVYILALTLILIKRIVKEKAESLFLFVAVFIGIYMIWMTPVMTRLSWDDQVHYTRTISISDFFTRTTYQTDINLYMDTLAGTNPIVERNALEEYEEKLEQEYSNGERIEQVYNDYGLYSIAYIPSAFIIIMARGLGLSFATIFRMGKVMNLLLYSIIIYYGIKKLRYGKTLVSCVGLIPTSLFMACSYSYDWWVISWCILGFCYLFSFLQRNEKIKTREFIFAIIAITVGSIPKAIYFVFLFPFLFIPMRCFENKKQKMIVIIITLCAALLLIVTFILPLLVNSAGISDTRGSSDVDSSAQIRYIINEFPSFIKMFSRYMKQYLSLDTYLGLTTFFAYLGSFNHWVLVTVVLFVTAFIDREYSVHNDYLVRITTIIAILGTAVLSAVAMYITFTPVGKDTVDGCQTRYLLPAIFPMLYSIGSSKISNNMNMYVRRYVPVVVMSLIILYGLFITTISKY